jgi:thiamine-phosphate pyrophosphorylase
MTAANDDLQTLMGVAASLRPRFGDEKPLPRLLFVTDPARTPDPAAIVRGLPAGCGVIYRAFGASDALETARTLSTLASERGLTLLIGADSGLAEACGAQGVHLPERALDKARDLKSRHPDWIVTAAAHSLEAARRAATAGCDAALVSAVFPSASPSAAAAMGADAFLDLVKTAPLPVYALGGVTARTASRLSGCGAQGLAMVEGLAGGVRT